MILAGLFSSLCFGSQLITFKLILRKQNDAFGIGFAFLLFCGILGLISLIVHASIDSGIWGGISVRHILYPMLIGFFTAGGIVLTNIAGGIGVAGISNSISHCQMVVVTFFNYFIFSQDISFIQFIGVILAVLGGIILAFEDKLIGKQKTEDKQTSN